MLVIFVKLLEGFWKGLLASAKMSFLSRGPYVYYVYFIEIQE